MDAESPLYGADKIKISHRDLKSAFGSFARARLDILEDETASDELASKTK